MTFVGASDPSWSAKSPKRPKQRRACLEVLGRDAELAVNVLLIAFVLFAPLRIIRWEKEATTSLTQRGLYNDAYSRSLGHEKHPAILGMSARQALGEIWDVIGPQIGGQMCVASDGPGRGSAIK